MSHANTPRFVYGGGGDFTPSLPARFWNPMDEAVGGVRVSAAGIPASYIVRRETLVDVPVRFTEAEWPDVLALVTFGQSSQVLTWYPDALEAENFQVYLQKPAAGEGWSPNRLGDYPRAFEVTLQLRGASGAAPWQAFFP